MKIIAFAILSFVCFSSAASAKTTTNIVCKNTDEVNKYIFAKSALLINPQSGGVIFSKNSRTTYPPASTVKLMTALLTYEKTGLLGTVTIQKQDTLVEPSRIPLTPGEKVPVIYLVKALLIGSDNDAALALARHVGGSTENFTEMMNDRAKLLGCSNTMFKNPNGLPSSGQGTTAIDLLRIFQKVVSIPELRQICMTKTFTLKTAAGVQSIRNHNLLLGVYDGMGPAKTGWTRSSQHTYAASAYRNGNELQLIILNSKNKWVDAKILFDYGFRVLESEKLASPKTPKKS